MSRLSTSIATVSLLVLGSSCSSPQTRRISLPDYAAAFWQADTLVVDHRDTVLLDALGQLYHWSQSNAVEKFRPANQLAGLDTLRYRYENPRFGKLTSIDLTNPIRPLLFYSDAQTVIWLNRNLTEWRRLSLLDLGFTSVDAIAYAPNDGLWLFDPDAQQLVQVDQNGKRVYESADLSQVFNQPVRARQLLANPQHVVVHTQEGRILLFNAFGAYRTELLRKGSSLQLVKDKLLFSETGQWQIYRLPTAMLEPLETQTARGDLVQLRQDFVLFRAGSRYWVHRPPGGD